MFAFENLEVYKKARHVHTIIYQLTKDLNSIPRYTTEQLGRASLSIMLNIAEGSAKIGEKDRRKFYVIARGSVFECASLIQFLNDEKELSTAVSANLLSNYDELSRMLFVMIRKLS